MLVQNLKVVASALGSPLLRSFSKAKIAALLAPVALFAVQSSAAVIFTNPITDTNPSLANPYTDGQNVAANVTASGIGRGAGISGSSGSNRYAGNGWNNATIVASITDNAYFTFTLTPAAGYEIDFDDFVYTGQASSTGPTSFSFRSSVDAFASDIGTPTATGTTISLTAASFQNLTTATEFRLYGAGASAAAGTFAVNSFTFNGDAVLVPEPASLGLIGVGALSLLRRRRSTVA